MPPAPNHLALRALMRPGLPPGMCDHIDRVVALGRELAIANGADEARTALTAQAHDLVRAWSKKDWLTEAERRGLEVLPLEREAPVLLHGPLGALLLEEADWVEDRRVLDAVRYHTTGHPAFDLEAWAMFVADKVEPRKLSRRPELQAVMDASRRSLQAGALTYLELMLADSRRGGQPEHPLATETREWLRARTE